MSELVRTTAEHPLAALCVATWLTLYTLSVVNTVAARAVTLLERHHVARMGARLGYKRGVAPVAPKEDA